MNEQTQAKTIRVSSWARAEAEQRIEKLLRWCGRNGIEPPTFRWSEERCVGLRWYDSRAQHHKRESECAVERARWRNEMQQQTLEWFASDLEIDGIDRVLSIGDGSVLLGCLVHTSAGTLATVCPGKSLPDSVLARHGECDHCNCVRSRTETFVIQQPDGIKVVGRSCIRAYLGLDPKRLAYAIESLEWIGSGCGGGSDEPGDDYYQGSGSQRVRSALEMVIAATAAYRENRGYLKEGARSNRQLAWKAIDGPTLFRSMPDEEREEELQLWNRLRALVADPTVIEDAEAALEWAKTLPGGDFNMTLRSIATTGVSAPRTHGAAIYLPAAWRRARGEEGGAASAPEQRHPLPELKEGSLPTAGAKIETEVRITLVRPYTTQWGDSWLILGRSTDGYEIKSFSSSRDFSEAADLACRERTTVRVRATVKGIDPARDEKGSPAAVLTRARILP